MLPPILALLCALGVAFLAFQTSTVETGVDDPMPEPPASRLSEVPPAADDDAEIPADDTFGDDASPEDEPADDGME